MSSALGDFKTVIQTLHELINVIDREVTKTIDSRDPNTVSATLAPRASAELLDAYKAFTGTRTNSPHSPRTPRTSV